MKKILLLVIAAIQTSMAFAQSLRVDAPNMVAADEQFTVSFIFEGEHKPSNFQWEAGNDFQLVWGPQQGSSTSIQIINGKQTKSVQFTYTYILLPKSTGQFTLAAAKAVVKGSEVSTQPHSIEVVAAGSGNTPSSSSSASSSQDPSSQISDSDIFLKMSLSRTKTVMGEPVTATIKLYQRANITGFDDAKFPSFNGFWSQDITPAGDIQFVRENVDGKIYNAAVIKKYVLIPQQAGSLTIEPSELICRLQVRVASAGNSIFDGFFDDFTTVRKRVTTPETVIKVTPLPSGAPASFGGGVGKFSMSATLSKDSLATHEAASLLVTVSGNGNVSLLTAPTVKFPLDMEAYDTKTTENVDKSSGGISGSKTYEFPFIPRSAGDFVIDPIQYSYYDIQAGKYVTLQTEPIPVHVVKGKETDAVATSINVPPTVKKKGVANLVEDIRYVHGKTPAFSTKGHFFVASPAFFIILALVAIAAVVVWMLLKNIARRKADIAGSKTRKATKMALKRLKKAGEYLQNNLYTAYYEELHKALLGFVADKLSIAVTDLSKDNISEKLTAANVEPMLVNEFVSMLDACEFARYAPDSGHQAMQAHFDEAVSVISMIDSKIRKSTNSAHLAVIVTLLLLLPSFASNAQDTDALWAEAVEAYSSSDWLKARQALEEIENQGLESVDLYYNLGNTWFKTGDYGKAVLYYERALKLDPSNSDVRYNLEVTGNYIQDDIEELPEFILKTWLKKLCYSQNSNTWAVLALVFFVLASAALLLFILGTTESWRKTGFFSAIASALLFVFCLMLSLEQRSEYYSQDSAVVMKAVTSAKSSPSADSSADLFILHEGTKVTLLDVVGEWSNIELSDGRQGWIRTSDIEII